MKKINDDMIQIYENSIRISQASDEDTDFKVYYNSALQNVIDSLKNQQEAIYKVNPHAEFDDIVRSFLVHSDIITPSEMRVILEAAIDELG